MKRNNRQDAQNECYRQRSAIEISTGRRSVRISCAAGSRRCSCTARRRVGRCPLCQEERAGQGASHAHTACKRGQVEAQSRRVDGRVDEVESGVVEIVRLREQEDRVPM